MIVLPWGIKLLLVPPAILFLAWAVGWLGHRRRWGRVLMTASVVALFAASLPAVGGSLLGALQDSPALETVPADAQAIVVLSAGMNSEAPEYGGATVDRVALERLRYAARLARASGLPILATGGPGHDDVPPVGTAMAEVLARDFAAPVRWIDNAAANTFENAEDAAAILQPLGIRRIVLVTHAWHMRRARRSFETVGFVVTPAPTGFISPIAPLAFDFVPSAPGLSATAFAAHEWLGLLWYEIAYF